MKKIYRFMSSRELSKLLNKEFIKDSRIWATKEDCTTSRGVSFLPGEILVTRECQFGIYLSTKKFKGFEFTPDLVWRNAEDEQKRLIIDFANTLHIARISMEFLVEFEVSDDVYNNKIHNCYGQYWTTLLKELYASDGYSFNDFKPVRVCDNMRYAAMMEDDCLDKYEFPKEDLNWIDLENKTYHDIKKLHTANVRARYQSRKKILLAEKQLEWESEMDALYS